jgi:hypothetical protein
MTAESMEFNPSLLLIPEIPMDSSYLNSNSLSGIKIQKQETIANNQYAEVTNQILRNFATS